MEIIVKLASKSMKMKMNVKLEKRPAPNRMTIIASTDLAHTRVHQNC